MTDRSGDDLWAIAGMLWAEGTYEVALRAMEEARDAYGREHALVDMARADFHIAELLLHYEHLEEAARRALEALRVREALGDVGGVAACELLLARSAAGQRRARDALHYCGQGYRRALAVNHFEVAAACLAMQGDVFLDIAQPTKAANAFYAAIKLYEGLGEPVEQARCALSLAAATSLSGNLAETVRILVEARRILSEAGHPYDRAGCDMSMAVALLEMGSPEDALPRLRDARTVFHNGMQSRSLAQCDLNLGNALRLLGRTAEAAKHLRLARSLFERGKAPVEAAVCSSNLAVVLRDAGDVVEAMKAALEAVAGLDAYRYALPYSGMRASWSRYAAAAYRHAFGLAAQTKDQRLLAELIESARLQAVPTGGDAPPPGATVAAALPSWAIGAGDEPEPRPRTLAQARAGRGLAGLGPMALGTPPAVSVAGRSELGGLRGDAASGDQPVAVEDAARHVGGAGAWWWGTWQVGSRLFWSLIRPGAEPMADSIDLAPGTGAATALREYEEALPRSDETGPGWQVRSRTSVLVADPTGEAALAWRLGSALLPPVLRAALARRAASDDEPLSLVIAPAQVLGRVAFPLLAVAEPRPDGDGARVLDAAVVRLSPPIALVDSCARRVPPRRPSPRPRPLQLAIVGDSGERDYPPVAEALTVDAVEVLGPPSWPAAQPVDRDGLAEHLAAVGQGSPAVCILFGHVEPPDTPDLPATTAFRLTADEEIVAHELLVPEDQTQLFPMPDRVLMLCCSSAGADVSPHGEWTGFGPALLWAGADCVVATSWPMLPIDTAIEVANTLVNAMAGDEDPAAALRREQRRWLARWRSTPPLAPDAPWPPRHPAPYLWALYVVLGVTRT
jgi:tetratricopeptide (TPR) repeat protein